MHALARRTSALALAAALALPLAACSEDGFSLPSGEELQGYVDDARSRADKIGAEIGDLASTLEGLPADARTKIEDAIAQTKEATGQARGALEEAAAAKDGAAGALDDAGAKVADAKAQVEQGLKEVEGATGVDADKARAELEKLRDLLGELGNDLTTNG